MVDKNINISKIDRINQLEGIKIDDECQEILFSKLLKSFQYFNPQTINKYLPEFNFVIKLLYFRFTIAIDNSQPGNVIQNIVYKNEKNIDGLLTKRQKILYFLLDIVLGYGINKLKNSLAYKNRERNSKILEFLIEILEIGEKIYKFFDLINFLLFLNGNKYRSLIERILSMKLVYEKENVSRYLDFEYLNRTILWNIISEFLIFVLPFLGRVKIKEQLKKLFYFTTFLGSLSLDPETDFRENKCFICGDIDKTMPFTIKECKHEFCYYCISSHMENKDSQKLKCPQCGVDFSEIEESVAQS